MGIPVLVMGESGSGKSTSLRNFEPDDIGIFNVAAKRLPFKKKLPTIDGANYNIITASLKKNSKKTYVIDDASYLMTFESFAMVNDVGFAKFTTFAINFYNLVQTAIKDTSPDTIVYFIMHTDRSDDGHLKAKTIGKMLDNQLTLEGLFSIVLLCKADGQKHYFETQSDGFSTAKSPLDLFDREMDNDLKLVDTKIREYYDLAKE